MEALDPLDENCIILNLRDFYAECLATVDIFYECIEKKSRIKYFQQNLHEYLSKDSHFGKWIQIMLSMSPPFKVDTLLRDIVTSFENEELINILLRKAVDPIKVKCSSGRESIFKAEEVYRFQVANIVALRVQLILGTEQSCGKRIFDYSLQYSTSDDLQLQAISNSFLLGKVKSDNDIATNITISKTIIPILISNSKQFENLCDNYHKLFHLELEAEKEMSVNILQFNELLTLIARTCVEEDLDFPLHYYLKDHHNLKLLHERKTASITKHSTIQHELDQFKLELKVLFAVLRTCMMTLCYCLANMFRLNLLDITTIGKFNNKSDGDNNMPLKTTNKCILSLLETLESLPWDILRKVSLLEQYLYSKSTSNINYNNMTSLQVTRIFATVCCLVHAPLAPTIIPWILDAFHDLMNDSAWLCHNNSVETSESPLPPTTNASSDSAIVDIRPNISDYSCNDHGAIITSIRTSIPSGVTINSILSYWTIRQYSIIWSEREQHCLPQDKLNDWLLDYNNKNLSNDDSNRIKTKEETDEIQWTKLLTPWVEPILKTSPVESSINKPVETITTAPSKPCYTIIEVISNAICLDSFQASLFLNEESVIDQLKLIATSEVGCAAYLNAKCEEAARDFLTEFMTGPTGSVGSLNPLHLIDYNLSYHPYLPVNILQASVSLCQIFHKSSKVANPLFSYIINLAVCHQQSLPNHQQIELAIPAFRILTYLLSGNMPSRLLPSRGIPHHHLDCTPQLASCIDFYNAKKYHILRCVALVARWLLQDCELEYTYLVGPNKDTLMGSALAFVASVSAISFIDVCDVFDKEVMATKSQNKNDQLDKWDEAFPATKMSNKDTFTTTTTTTNASSHSLAWMSILLSILKYGTIPCLPYDEPYAIIPSTWKRSYQSSILKKEVDVEVEVVSRKINIQEACVQLLCVLTHSDRQFCDNLLSIVSDGGTESTVSDCIRCCLQSSHTNNNIIQHSFRLALYLCQSTLERDRNSYTSSVYRFKMSFTHIRSSSRTSNITGKGNTSGGTGFSAGMEILIATLKWLISHLAIRILMVSENNTHSQAMLVKEECTTTTTTTIDATIATISDNDDDDDEVNNSKYKYLLVDPEETEIDRQQRREPESNKPVSFIDSLDLYTALDICLLGLECIAATCEGRAELQEKIVMEFEVIFSLLPKLLTTLCSYANACSDSQMQSRKVNEECFLETGFYCSIIATVAKSLRAFVGRFAKAKELALSHGSLEGVIPSLQFAVGTGVTVYDIQLGQQLARTVEALTSRNIRAWARVEKVAGAKGLLSLSFLGRPVIQIQAMTSLAAIMSSQASIGEYHYVNEVVKNGGVLVARDLLSHQDSGVQYAALRLLQSLLLHSLDTQCIAFRLDVLLPLCTLLESLEPSIVRETCAVLVLFGSWDQTGLRGLVDAKSMEDKNGNIMSTIRNKLMTIACGRSQSKLGVDIPSALAQDISSAARAAAFSLACATDPEESNWPDGGAPLRSTLTTAGIRHPY